MMIKKLHHSAYRCRDSEETRAFYEDFLGLPLVNALRLSDTKTGREVQLLHTFYALEDASCLAFFEVPGLKNRPGWTPAVMATQLSLTAARTSNLHIDK